MNIVVCIKQTPVPAEARLDDATKTLVRDGVTLTISSLDRRALLEAVRIRDGVGGAVTVLTMGPPQARSALVDCMALGADRAVLLTDPQFAGADTLATARTLSMALQRLKSDLIVCGKFTIDSETGQVPSEIAEFMDLPQVTSVRKIAPTERPGVIWVERETDDGYEQYEVTLPALLSVTELIISGRRPTPEELEVGQSKPLEVWTAEELEADPSVFGAAGSPTRVAELRSAEMERDGTAISGEEPEEAAKQLIDYLLEHGLFQTRRHIQGGRPRRTSPSRPDPTKAIWVVAELSEGRPRGVTFELLGKAQELADHMNGEVAAVLIGGSEVATNVGALGAYGADTVYLAGDDRLTVYDTELYTSLLVSAIRGFQPYAVLAPSTTNGRDLAPRAAARLQVGLTGDCVGLEFDEQGDLAQLKPAFGGDIVSPIYSKTVPVMATVRPSMLEACEPNWVAQPKIVELDVPKEMKPRVNLLKSAVEPEIGTVKLEDADVVIGVGLGVGGPENVPVVRQLAEALDAALASSLQVAAAGWLPSQLQIGLTGKAVAPHSYIAVGISGQPNHLLGAKKTEHIIAINNDPEAPIFKAADFGVVGDWAQIVPALTRSVLALKSASPR